MYKPKHTVEWHSTYCQLDWKKPFVEHSVLEFCGTPSTYLQIPSGIISKWLSAALNTSSSCSLPIPAGMPLKSIWLLLMKSLLSARSLHKDAYKWQGETTYKLTIVIVVTSTETNFNSFSCGIIDIFNEDQNTNLIS